MGDTEDIDIYGDDIGDGNVDSVADVSRERGDREELG